MFLTSLTIGLSVFLYDPAKCFSCIKQ